MTLLPLMTQIAAGCSLLALVWLTVRAFTRKSTWGLAVMLTSPVGATLFGLRYWDEEKKAFLAYMVTFATTAALALTLFTAWGGWDLIRATYQVNSGINSHMLTTYDAEYFLKANMSFNEKSGLNIQDTYRTEKARQRLASAAKERADRELADLEAAEDNLSVDSISKKAVAKNERYRLVYIPIKVTDAKNYVGSTVKVTRKNVPEKEYRLIGSSGQKLELSQHAGKGSYSFSYRTGDIEKIRVLTKQQY